MEMDTTQKPFFNANTPSKGIEINTNIKASPKFLAEGRQNHFFDHPLS
ncbi:hypothetical protein [Staphylococcus aureus]